MHRLEGFSLSQDSKTTYLSIAEAAKKLSCAEITVRRAVTRGELRAYRFGRLLRIRLADLEKIGRPVTNLAELRGGDRVA